MALVISPEAVSYPNGIQGVKDSGVTATEHNKLRGRTLDYWTPRPIQLLGDLRDNCLIVGGPSDPSNINQGGFNLWVSDGELSPSDATVQSYSVNEVSHTEAGNDQTS